MQFQERVLGPPDVPEVEQLVGAGRHGLGDHGEEIPKDPARQKRVEEQREEGKSNAYSPVGDSKLHEPSASAEPLA